MLPFIIVDQTKSLHRDFGSTVYFYIHIGNARAFVFADLLRRYLEYKNYKVKQVMNITDVGHMTVDEVADGKGEDKLEKEAKKERKTPWQIADFYTKAFLEDSRKLNILEPAVRPKATKHIKEMVALIQKLIKNGYAYEKNGSVFYEISKFRDYGKLSGNTLDKLKVGARLGAHPDKKDPRDFALWISDPKHIMSWKTSWSEKGYPGWHLECSAMSMKYLGSTIDIHTGGEDNIFPHHECEIAQSEGATGKKFVNCWMHTRHLLVNKEKMSKSKGNFYTVRDVLEKGHDPRVLRYLLLSAHYRIPLNFTFEGLDAAKKSLDRLDEFISKLKEVEGPKQNTKIDKLVKKTGKDFENHMDDDLNISGALSSVFEFVKEVNKIMDTGEIGGKNARDVYTLLMDFDGVLGLRLGKEKEAKKLKKDLIKIIRAASGKGTKGTDKELIEKIMEIRQDFRDRKDFKRADKIRDLLEKIGVILEDKEGKTIWKLK